MKKRYDPVEHHRTTQPHAGVAFRSMVAIPVLLLIIGGVIVTVAALAAAGYMQPHWAALLGGVAMVIGIIGIALSVADHRRIRRNEAHWLAENKDAAGRGDADRHGESSPGPNEISARPVGGPSGAA